MNRLEKICTIRKSLAANQPSIGSWIQIPHPSVAEIMGQAGYDWVAVDMEHGAISVQQLPDLFRALELGGTLPLARLAQGRTKDCKQALDAGAGGVIVPMVETAEQLIQVRDACRWPPAGTRGVGFSRANLFGKHFDAYREEAQAPLLVAMIEHVRAVENLDDILLVEGLDAILIGPYDLSASMGITAKFEEAEFTLAMGRIRTLCGQHNIPCGVHVVQPDPSVLEQRVVEGYRFIAYSLDSVFFHYSAENPVRSCS
jgi:2-dehydro-3-deoxyglucarate aldolase